LRGPPNLAQRQQLHVDFRQFGPRLLKQLNGSIGGVNHATGEPRTRVACRIGFQVVLFFMHDYRFSNDRIWTAQIEFPFPLEVPLAGSISFNIAEIAGVTLRPRRPVVVLMRRIEMRARRHRIRRRAIAFLVYVDTVLARFEVLDVGNDAHFVASLCERDRASNLAP